jgi:hypothetical protein
MIGMKVVFCCKSSQNPQIHRQILIHRKPQESIQIIQEENQEKKLDELK